MKSKLFVMCLVVSALVLMVISIGGAMAKNGKSPFPRPLPNKSLPSLSTQVLVATPIARKRAVNTVLTLEKDYDGALFLGEAVSITATLKTADGTPLRDAEIHWTSGAGTITVIHDEDPENCNSVGYGDATSSVKQGMNKTNVCGQASVVYKPPRTIDCRGTMCEISDIVSAMFYGAETDLHRYQYSVGIANIIVVAE